VAFAENASFKSSGGICWSPLLSSLPGDLSMDKQDSSLGASPFTREEGSGTLRQGLYTIFQMDWKRARRPITKYTFPFGAILITGKKYRER
jgi:hypothetical protein